MKRQNFVEYLAAVYYLHSERRVITLEKISDFIVLFEDTFTEHILTTSDSRKTASVSEFEPDIVWLISLT